LVSAVRVNDCPKRIEYDYRMIVVSDAMAEIDRTTHEAELTSMNRIFADVKTTDKVVQMFYSIRP
jgi:isochorismate hydrolase